MKAIAQSKQGAKLFNPERARRTIIRMAQSPYDPEIALKKATENLERYWAADEAGDEAGKDMAMAEIQADQDNLTGAIGLDTHALLILGVSKEHRAFVIEYARRMEKELGECSVTEKTLIQTAASAYGRHLSCTQRLESALSLGRTSPEVAAHCAVLSKEADRSHRQLMASLSALRAIRTPPLAVTIGSI